MTSTPIETKAQKAAIATDATCKSQGHPHLLNCESGRRSNINYDTPFRMVMDLLIRMELMLSQFPLCFTGDTENQFSVENQINQDQGRSIGTTLKDVIDASKTSNGASPTSGTTTQEVSAVLL